MLGQTWEVHIEFDRLTRISKFNFNKRPLSDLIFIGYHEILYGCIISVAFYFNYFVRIFKWILDILCLEDISPSISNV